VQPGDPRADPAVIDLIELSGLWLAAGDRPALERSLQRLVDVLQQRFPEAHEFRARFVSLKEDLVGGRASTDELRRSYRRATLG
jgi:hypothetical protein